MVPSQRKSLPEKVINVFEDKYDLRFFQKAAILLLAMAVLNACKKPEENLGTDLLPDGQELGVVVVDTVTMLAYTVEQDSVRTSGLTRNMLGSYLDRDMGEVKASIVTQILLSTNNVGDGLDPNDLELDSIVLSLEYEELDFGYGHLDPQVFKVYELDTLLNADSSYYNHRIPAHLSQDLVKFKGASITPAPGRPAYVGEDTLFPQLRIPLDQTLGERFLQRFGQAELANNTAFLDFFNGLYIEVDNQNFTPYERAVLYMDLLDGDSKVALYYRDVANGDTLQFDFVINSNAVRYSTTEFDYSRALSPALPMALADTAMNINCYTQAGGGLRTVIQTPYLNLFNDIDLTALNKVELVIPSNPQFNPSYAPSTQLFAFRKNDEGQDAVIPDQSSIFGSTLGLWDSDNNEYRFNLTLYFQSVLNGTNPNNGLFIVPNNGGVSVNRTILQGPEHPLERMRMELTFTEY